MRSMFATSFESREYFFASRYKLVHSQWQSNFVPWKFHFCVVHTYRIISIVYNAIQASGGNNYWHGTHTCITSWWRAEAPKWRVSRKKYASCVTLLTSDGTWKPSILTAVLFTSGSDSWIDLHVHVSNNFKLVMVYAITMCIEVVSLPYAFQESTLWKESDHQLHHCAHNSHPPH